MSSQQVSFGCTALVGTNKQGVILPDADGYYTVILGAFDFENSYGAVYPLTAAKELFKESSGFMRRLRAGYCRGEYGHPKRLPGQDHDSFIRRIMTIEETRICMHIKDVWLDYNSVSHEGKKVVTVFGKIRPEGPYGAYLADSLSNPNCNVAFSLRSITIDEYIRGRLYKHIDDIACWDFVVEPGIKVANKYKCPALEEYASVTVPLSRLRDIAANDGQHLGLESAEMLRQIIARHPVPANNSSIILPPSDTWVA